MGICGEVIYSYHYTLPDSLAHASTKVLPKIQLPPIPDQIDGIPVYDYKDIFTYRQDEWALVAKDGKYGLLNCEGILLIPLEFQYIGSFGWYAPDLALVKKNNLYGFIYTNGEIVIPIENQTVEMMFPKLGL